MSSKDAKGSSAGKDGKDGKDGKKAREDDWTVGFRTGAKKGMTCDTCRCLVRENPGDATAHRRWHASLKGR